MHAVTKRVDAARFLCRAAWRCVACDTPWYCRETAARAAQHALDHNVEVHGALVRRR